MIIIKQQGEQISIDGTFEIYGTQEQLLKFSQQLRDQSLRRQVGWVQIDTEAEMVVQKVVPFKEKAATLTE